MQVLAVLEKKWLGVLGCLPLMVAPHPWISAPTRSSSLPPPTQSLLELHKRRKALTEPEARYYLRQIVLGCQYLHRNRVIHRDLKLGNLFLNEDLEVKIGEALGLRVLDTTEKWKRGGRGWGEGETRKIREAGALGCHGSLS